MTRVIRQFLSELLVPLVFKAIMERQATEAVYYTFVNKIRVANSVAKLKSNASSWN